MCERFYLFVYTRQLQLLICVNSFLMYALEVSPSHTGNLRWQTMMSRKLEWLKARMKMNSMKHNFKEALTIFIHYFNMLLMFSSMQSFVHNSNFLFIRRVQFNMPSLYCSLHSLHLTWYTDFSSCKTSTSLV